MEFQIARRIKDVRGSIIRELFKLASNPDIIAFGGGNPSPQSFPTEDIARIADDALRNRPVEVLQYGLSEGYTPLRETMKRRLSSEEGFDFSADELFITSGGIQAADLVAKVLVNEGDVVLTEEPAFVGCLNTFRTYGAKLIGVPMEPDGMDIRRLENALRSHGNVRFLYTISSFQNPTGFTTSREKRKEIYRLAQKYNIAIFEDNPYGELRFSGERIPAIKTLDTDGRVLYAGSFSKVMAPAFRLGFLVFSKDIVPSVTVAKQSTDTHSNLLFQYICDEYMNKCDYAGHIRATRALYREKSELMYEAMNRYFHPGVTYGKPDGGLFIMAFLPQGMDSNDFVREGIKNGVACVPGVAFAVDQNKPSNGFRMCYSTPSDEQIARGIKILGGLTHKWLA